MGERQRFCGGCGAPLAERPETPSHQATPAQDRKPVAGGGGDGHSRSTGRRGVFAGIGIVVLIGVAFVIKEGLSGPTTPPRSSQQAKATQAPATTITTSAPATATATTEKPPSGSQTGTATDLHCLGAHGAAVGAGGELRSGSIAGQCSAGGPPTSLTPLNKSVLRNVTWTGWGTNNAAGTGEFWADNCTPDCASGTYESIGRAAITASEPRAGTCSGVPALAGRQLLFYTRVAFTLLSRGSASTRSGSLEPACEAG